jgi:hypothetical protein
MTCKHCLKETLTLVRTHKGRRFKNGKWVDSEHCDTRVYQCENNNCNARFLSETTLTVAITKTVRTYNALGGNNAS